MELTLSAFDQVSFFGHWITDAEGKIIRSRGQALLLAGLSPAQIEGTSVLDKVVQPNGVERYRWGDNSVAIFSSSKEGKSGIVRSKSSGSQSYQQREYYTAYAPLYDDDGSFAGTIAIYMDVTAVKQEEQTRLYSLLERFLPKLENWAEQEVRALELANEQAVESLKMRADLSLRLRNSVQHFLEWAAPKLAVPFTIVVTALALAFAARFGVVPEALLQFMQPGAGVVQPASEVSEP